MSNFYTKNFLLIRKTGKLLLQSTFQEQLYMKKVEEGIIPSYNIRKEPVKTRSPFLHINNDTRIFFEERRYFHVRNR